MSAIDLPRARRIAGRLAFEVGRLHGQLEILERASQSGIIARASDRLFTRHQACVDAAESLINIRAEVEECLAALPPPRLGGGK